MLQWACEACRYIEGETISNCWVKADILPVIHAKELKGKGNIKAKRGAVKFKHAYDDSLMTPTFTISYIPTVKLLVTPLIGWAFSTKKKVSAKWKWMVKTMN